LWEPGEFSPTGAQGGSPRPARGNLTFHHVILHRIAILTIMKLTAVFQQVPEGYIGFVEELPGANTQGQTLEEARTNLREAVELVLQANRELARETLQGQSNIIRETLELPAA
jgi:predicted RNase H-like HicB family nuclease